MCNLLKLNPLNLFWGLALEEFSSESEVTRLASGSLEHLRDADPRGHFSKGEPDEDVTKSTELNGGVVGGGGSGALHGLRVAGDTKTEVDGDISKPGELTHASVLELGLAEVVHGDVVRDAEGVESNISDVSLAVDGVREEGNGGRLLGSEAGGGTAYTEVTVG